MTTLAIDDHLLRLWRREASNSNRPGQPLAGIYLYGDQQYRGYVYFFAPDACLPPDTYDAVNGRVFIHRPLTRLQDYLQMLKSGVPLQVCYSISSSAVLQPVEPSASDAGPAEPVRLPSIQSRSDRTSAAAAMSWSDWPQRCAAL